MKTRHITILLTTLLLTACITTPEKVVEPAWVTGDSIKFPTTLYITGHGSATELNSAKDIARSEIAKQFEVAIQEQTQQTQSYTQTQEEKGTALAEEQTSRSITTHTSRTLQGIEIGEQWRDKANKRYHVLAVLSRSRAQQQFEQEIDHLDRSTAQQLAQTEATPSPLAKAAHLQKAIELQQQRRMVQNGLQIVGVTGQGAPAPLSLPELQKNRDAIINKIKLATSATGELQDDLQHQLSSAASAAGFFLSEEGADYTLNVNTTLDPLILQRGWYWLRGTLELNLKDSSGRDVGIQRWPLKVSSITIEQTRQRLLDDTNAILSQRVRDSVLTFAVTPTAAVKK